MRLTPRQPARLEAVVHAEDVQAHLVVGIALAAAQQVGQVDDAVGLRLYDGAGDLLKIGDVHPRAAHVAGIHAGNVGQRVDVGGVHVLAALHQFADHAGADETGSSQNQYRHDCTSQE